MSRLRHPHLRGVPAAVLTSLLLLPAATANAAVSGRYFRIEALASSRMALHEIELWSNSANIARDNRSLVFAGLAAKEADVSRAGGTKALVDGAVDFSLRPFVSGTAEG